MRKILNMLGAAAVLIGFTACADTDAQYTIPDVDAPQLVATTPADGSSTVRNGDVTITVEYDKNIFFYSGNYGQIEISNGTISSASVVGTSTTLTISANCPSRGATVTVTIPEGLVTGPNSVPAPEVSFSFSTIGLDGSPVMATSAKAKKLYSYLIDNFGTKILSGMMANVAWNTECADEVYGWTGKYPAINGFDYIHMPASEAGANWIDYTDISPVSDWTGNGGIATMTWHWLVPKTEVSTTAGDTDATTIWTGNVELGSSWGVSETVDASAFAGIEAGNVLRVCYTIDSQYDYWQVKLMDSSWTALTSYADEDNGWGCIALNAGTTSHDIVLNEADVEALTSSGMIISGYGIIVTSLQIAEAASAPDYSSLDPNSDFTYVPDETTFDAANALTEGTWENYVWQHDMAILVKYLTLLKDADIPVLWRPFHEASGQWFWWGAAGADTFKALWIEMFNELNAAGLDNLIWVWTSCGSDEDWYPGDTYVDIVGRDLYGDGASSCASEYSALTSTYGNKLVTLAECGWSEYTTSRVATITEQWEAGAKWSWFMPWYDNSGAENSHATQEWWEDAMSNGNVITRDQVSY